MPHLNCNPISDPPLPDAVRFHPIWDSWDLAIDQVLSRLLKSAKEETVSMPLAGNIQNGSTKGDSVSSAQQQQANGSQSAALFPNLGNVQYTTFFEQQLTAFEICQNLKVHRRKRRPNNYQLFCKYYYHKCIG